VLRDALGGDRPRDAVGRDRIAAARAGVLEDLVGETAADRVFELRRLEQQRADAPWRIEIRQREVDRVRHVAGPDVRPLLAGFEGLERDRLAVVERIGADGVDGIVDRFSHREREEAYCRPTVM
jgi:hypothetical protein